MSEVYVDEDAQEASGPGGGEEEDMETDTNGRTSEKNKTRIQYNVLSVSFARKFRYQITHANNLLTNLVVLFIQPHCSKWRNFRRGRSPSHDQSAFKVNPCRPWGKDEDQKETKQPKSNKMTSAIGS